MLNHEILKVNDLAVHFHLEKRIIPAVDGVSFSVSKGETLVLLENRDAVKV